MSQYKNPTIKQQQLAKKYAEALRNGENVTKKQLLLEAGYSECTANTHTSLPFDSRGFKMALRDVGIDPTDVTQVFKDAMQANRVVEYRGTAQESDVPDHRIRLDAAKTLGKYAGLEKHVVETHNINVDADADIDDLKTMLGLGE